MALHDFLMSKLNCKEMHKKSKIKAKFVVKWTHNQ